MTGMAEDAPQPVRLNPSTRVPLYQQIFVILRNRIASGALAPGQKIMGEAELCAEFAVSRITARRALNELADQGFVVRERGRGTRVVEHDRPPSMIASLDGLLENIGHIGRTTSVDVLDFGYVPASPDVAHALELAKGARVQRAVRVRSLGAERMSYLVTYVPEHIGSLIEGKDMSETPLLILLEEAGVAVSSARQKISATIADAEVAAALQIPAGAPLIDVLRVVRDADARPVELIRVLYRPELYHYEVSMTRVEDDRGRTWSADGTPDAAGQETFRRDPRSPMT